MICIKNSDEILSFSMNILKSMFKMGLKHLDKIAIWTWTT